MSDPLPMDPAELDARWSQWSRGANAVVHAPPHQFDAQGNDFRSYLANLEQEIRGREAAMDSDQSPPLPSGNSLLGTPAATETSRTSVSGGGFSAQAFAETEDVMR